MQNKRFLYLNSVNAALSALNLSKKNNVKIFSVYRNADYDFEMLSKMNSPYLFKSPTPECILGVYHDTFYADKVNNLLYMLQSLSFVPANFISDEPEEKNLKMYTPIFTRTVNDYLSGKEYKKDFAMDSLKTLKKAGIPTIFNISMFGKINYEVPDLSIIKEESVLKSIVNSSYSIDDFHPLFFIWIDEMKKSDNEDIKRMFRPICDIYNQVDNLYIFLNEQFELLKSRLGIVSPLNFDNLTKEIFNKTNSFEQALLVSDYLSLKYSDAVMKRYLQDKHV